MTLNHIQTSNKSIKVQGKVFYNDRRRRIDIKRPIRDLFEETSENNIEYVMELCMNQQTAINRVKELSNKKVIPVLLYFTEGKNKQ
jgi:hypothetical protein